MKSAQLHAAAFLLLVCAALFFMSQDKLTVSQSKSQDAFKSGMLAYNDAYYQKAIFYFKDALSNDSKNHLARYMIGWSYFKSGFMQNALFEWENLLSLGFTDNLFQNMLDNIYFQEGNFSNRRVVKNYAFYAELSGKKLEKEFFVWPLGMGINEKNEIFIAGHRSNNVLKLKNGKVESPLTVLGVSLGYPYDIAFDKSADFVYVSDFKNNVIYKITYGGTIVKKIGSDFTGTQKLLGPAGIDTDSLGNLIVVDQGNNRIVRIDRDGKFVFAFGSMGKEYGEFFKPIDVVYIEKEKKLYVSNFFSDRIDVFDQWGNYLESIEDENIKEPRGLFYNADTDVLYAATKNGVVAYDFLSKSTNLLDLGTTEINDPYFILIDKNQNLIVSQPGKHSISYFIPKDELYLNLDVKIERLNTKNYPFIVGYVSVKDQSGRTIYGLGDENFTFSENDTAITRLNTDFTYLLEQNPAFSFIVDSNPAMFAYRDKVNEILERLSAAFPPRLVYNYYFTNTLNQTKPYQTQLLSLKNDVSDKRSYGGDGSFDQTFYTSVSGFQREFKKGAIILFTDGSLLQGGSFSTYSQNDVINYAKNNYLPVYIFYFGSEQNRTFFSEIAEKTGGHLFEKEELIYPETLVRYFNNYQSPLYIVYYKSPYSYVEDFFRKIMVTVKYNGRVGKNWLGYYMPPTE